MPHILGCDPTVHMQLVYSTGRLIDALLGGAAQNYLEFKLLQQRCLCHLSMRCLGCLMLSI